MFYKSKQLLSFPHILNVFLTKNNIEAETHIHTYTHPYGFTHACPNLISTSERRRRHVLEIKKDATCASLKSKNKFRFRLQLTIKTYTKFGEQKMKSSYLFFTEIQKLIFFNNVLDNIFSNIMAILS